MYEERDDQLPAPSWCGGCLVGASFARCLDDPNRVQQCRHPRHSNRARWGTRRVAQSTVAHGLLPRLTTGSASRGLAFPNDQSGISPRPRSSRGTAHDDQGRAARGRRRASAVRSVWEAVTTPLRRSAMRPQVGRGRTAKGCRRRRATRPRRMALAQGAARAQRPNGAAGGCGRHEPRS